MIIFGRKLINQPRRLSRIWEKCVESALEHLSSFSNWRSSLSRHAHALTIIQTYSPELLEDRIGVFQQDFAR